MKKSDSANCVVTGKAIKWSGKGRRPLYHASVTTKQRAAYVSAKPKPKPISKTPVAMRAPELIEVPVAITREFAEQCFAKLSAKAAGCGPVAGARLQAVVSGILAALNVYRLQDIPPNKYAFAASLFMVNSEVWGNA